jgi:hypothetical protein
MEELTMGKYDFFKNVAILLLGFLAICAVVWITTAAIKVSQPYLVDHDDERNLILKDCLAGKRGETFFSYNICTVAAKAAHERQANLEAVRKAPIVSAKELR